MLDDPIVSLLLSTAQNAADRELAARYSPVIRFDVREPFLPLAAGYTIFRASGSSQSYSRGRTVDVTPPASLAIEYAIWWDWDIGHLYELEHIWVFVDANGRVVRAEASWHGEFHDMSLDGQLALEGDHPVVFSQPGKHAFAPTSEWFRERHLKRSETKELAGIGGVLLAPYIKNGVQGTPLKHLLARTYLAQHAFEPSGDFSNDFHFTPTMFVPWQALCDWMPVRVNHILDRLQREIPPSSYRYRRVGHRGTAAHAPDNTLLGLRTAAGLGADMAEIDVQQTADGHTVLSHNYYLTDAVGQVRIIDQSTLADLKAIDLGQGEHIPTLAEAVEVCKEELIGAYIEIKDGRCVAPVAAALRDQRLAEHCIIGSFRPDWLANMKKVAPELPTSILFSSPFLDAVKLAQSIRASYVHPCWDWMASPSAALTPEWVAAVRTANLGIVCWHEERPGEIAALRHIGVDAICSDAPGCPIQE